MNIVSSYITNNVCYTNGSKITPKGLMLHSVGCAQPSAAVFVKGYDKANYNVAVHAFIDGNTGDVHQTLPWNYRAYHAGSGSKGSANGTHIGIEMCEPSKIKYTTGANFNYNTSDLASIQECIKTTYDSAVELFAYLCKEYKLDPLADGVIISHSEGYTRGIASNHGDPVHLWTQAKTSYTMDGFRKDVAKKMESSVSDKDTTIDSTEESDENNKKVETYRVRTNWDDKKSQLGAYKILDNAKALADANPGYNVYDSDGNLVYSGGTQHDKSVVEVPFLVRVTTPNLLIRVGPGKDNSLNGRTTGIGTFTIVEVQNGSGSDSGWGLLKSYAQKRNGWIALDYVTKL